LLARKVVAGTRNRHYLLFTGAERFQAGAAESSMRSRVSAG
jgi:hypothetical protein